MAVNVNETEAKYDAPGGAAVPDLGHLPRVAATSGPDEQRLEAEYYDTDDLRLIRAGITLRRRCGGDDEGWHLKLPVSAGTRREIRLPLGAAGRIPAELAGLVRVHSRGEELRPIARIATTRRRVTLLDEAGDSLAEVADDDVSAQTMGGSTTVSRWHEVEVELTGGDRKLLKAADGVLRHGGLRPAGRAAKLERALGDRMPRRAPDAPLDSAAPAGQVVLAYLRATARALTSLDPMVRRDEPDAVHQMRVAARRLRGTLRSFGDVLRGGETGRLAGELQWLGSVLGKERDAEVLSAHLLQALHEFPAELVIGPVQAHVQGHFATARAAAHAEVIAALDSDRYFALLDGLDRLLAAPPFTAQAAEPAADVLPAAARRAYRKAARRVRRAWRAAPGRPRDAGLHRARKAARRARYASEAMTSAIGAPARRFARKMKKVQSVLGENQDTVIARRAARELGIAAHLAGDNAFSYGLVYGRGARDAERLQERARRIWKRASRRRHRRWLH
jgi:CHAD domain-containing protein